MTQDEIIEMARQVKIEAESDTLCRFGGWVEPFVAFANLVAAKERETLAQTQEPVSSDPLPRACNLAGVDYQTFLKIKAYMPVAPPQRTWVGLTDEDKHEIELRAGITEDDDGYIVSQVFKLTEAKLKEKNT